MHTFPLEVWSKKGQSSLQSILFFTLVEDFSFFYAEAILGIHKGTSSHLKFSPVYGLFIMKHIRWEVSNTFHRKDYSHQLSFPLSFSSGPKDTQNNFSASSQHTELYVIHGLLSFRSWLKLKFKIYVIWTYIIHIYV